MKFHHREILTDKQGYLIHKQDWSEELAIKIAHLEGIILRKAHWQVIYFIRAFYLQYNISPSVRMLIKAMKNNNEKKWNSHYLFLLFPDGPAKQATKIAGLPKPAQCL